MQLLRENILQHNRTNACEERRHSRLLLLQKVQSEQRLVQERLTETKVDRVLRTKRKGPLSSPKPETTFSFLKPETVKRGAVGEVLARFERKGFQFRELKLHHITKSEAEKLYVVHRSKPFFQELVSHVTSGPVVLMILDGPNAVDTVRRMVGATNPLEALPGTIRGDLSLSITANSIHASDSAESVKREASIFFPNRD